MAAASSTFFSSSSFECRSDPTGNPKPEKVKAFRSVLLRGDGGGGGGACRLSSLILRFPPNFVRQLSIKARRNCSNIGVAQIVAASWSNPASPPPPSAVDGAVVVPLNEDGAAGSTTSSCCNSNNNNAISGVQLSSGVAKYDDSFLRSPGSLAIHAGERLGRGIVTDAITTPIVQTSAYKFKSTAELLSFKEGTFKSFEYGRYGNPTTEVAEEKISVLEGAESTLLMASGMNATTIMMMALVPSGGHIVTTTDCYRKTRIFIQTILPKMGITATIIDPADMDALKSALDQHDVSLFFTESPTNPFLHCVDIELVSKLCHSKGALVCIDGTFATPINQKALALGADIVLQSATKYLAGHNDVIAGCISGSKKVISTIRTLHHVMGGVINPNAAYGIIRGMKTLHLRVQQHNSTGLRMAQILEAHPKIIRVHYPGLQSHPQHHIAKKQMSGFGGVVSFEVAGDLMTTAKFVDALKIPYIAPSFGGPESFVDQPAIMSYWDSPPERAEYGIKDNLIRFSFGTEDFEDLKSDIFQALDAI